LVLERLNMKVWSGKWQNGVLVCIGYNAFENRCVNQRVGKFINGRKVMTVLTMDTIERRGAAGGQVEK